MGAKEEKNFKKARKWLVESDTATVKYEEDWQMPSGSGKLAVTMARTVSTEWWEKSQNAVGPLKFCPFNLQLSCSQYSSLSLDPLLHVLFI